MCFRVKIKFALTGGGQGGDEGNPGNEAGSRANGEKALAQEQKDPGRRSRRSYCDQQT